MPDYSDTRVNNVIFNVLDSAKYNTLSNNSQINTNELYFITDDVLTPASIGALSTIAWDSTNKKITKTSSSTTDVVQFIAGSNVTLTAAAGTLTIASTDTNTTYSMTRDGESVKLTPSSGSAQSITLSSLINGLSEGSSPATANDYIVAQYAGGGTSTTTYHRRKLSNIFKALSSSDVTTALGFTPANSSHDHPLSIATDSGTSNVTLTSGGKFKLTAGGKSIVFTMPTSNNYSHPTYTANTAAAVKVGNDSTGHVVLGAAITASDVGAATSGHTHTISLASDSGTSTVSLTYGGKFKLTAGGNSVIFTMPSASSYTHPSYTAADAAAVKIGRDATGHVVIGNALTASDVGAATSGHTHATSIATSTGTNQITLALGSKYAITAGGTSYVFTMPSKPSYTASDVGAATSDHTHGLSIAADSGTSSVTLAANTKYKLTAGGSTYVFTTQPNPSPSDIGAAASSHNHAASDITSGTLPVERGGTGASSFTANSLIISGSTTTAALTTRAITNNTSNTAITTGTNIPTMNTIYYGLVLVNGSAQSRATTIYAPTSAGTSGYILTSNGSGAPTWTQILSVSHGGTGATTFTSGYLLTGNGTGAVQAYQPAWQAWVGGTTAGPQAKIKLGNVDYTSTAIPSATASASGIVTTGTQTFAGDKTFQSDAFRIRNNQSSATATAGSNPYITTLMLGDGREVTFDEYSDGRLSIHGNNGILLHPVSGGIAAFSNSTASYAVGAIVYYERQYYRCTTAITEAGDWTGSTNWTALPTASGGVWVHGNLNPTVTNTYTLGTTSYRWKNVYIGTASSYGGTAQPIYWNSGVPAALSATVGSGTQPVYLSSGTITASSSTVGGTAKPVYMSSGTITACSSTVGSGTQPVYMSSGTITASSSTVGGTAKPVYMSSGTITACSSTVGGAAQPVYMSSGTITACSSTVGSGTKPVYMSSGTITASSSTVGASNQLVYMSSGTITAGLTIRSGTDVPASSLGSNGDIYIKYTA